MRADADNRRNPGAWRRAAMAADHRAAYFGPLLAYASFPCADWTARDTNRFTGPFEPPTATPSSRREQVPTLPPTTAAQWQ